MNKYSNKFIFIETFRSLKSDKSLYLYLTPSTIFPEVFEARATLQLNFQDTATTVVL